MSLDIKKINQLPQGNNPTQQSLVAVYNSQSGVTERVTLQEALNLLDDSARYVAGNSYDTGEIVTFGSPVQLFESLVDNNTTVPQDDGVNWQVVNTTDTEVEWSAGVFSKPALRVFDSGLYYLPSTVTFPYNSSTDPNLDTNWIALAGGNPAAIQVSQDNTNKEVLTSANQQGVNDEIETVFQSILSSGLTEQPTLSNPSGLTFRVENLKGRIYDRTASAGSKLTEFDDALLDITLTDDSVNYIYRNNSGLALQTTPLTFADKTNGKVNIAAAVAQAGNIVGFIPNYDYLGNLVQQLGQFARFLGTGQFERSKFLISANLGDNLQLDISTGELWNWNSADVAGKGFQTITGKTAFDFRYINQNGDVSAIRNTIQPDTWDDGGTDQTVNSNDYLIATIYQNPDETITVLRSQNIYTSFDNAVGALDPIEGDYKDYIVPPQLNGSLRAGILIHRDDATNLVSEIAATTGKRARIFTDFDKFGNLAGIGGGYGTTNALLIANNLSDLADVAQARTNLDVYSKSEIDNAARTGNSIDWSAPATYGTDASPISGTLTDINTNARAGLIQKIYFNDATLNVPADWVLLGSETFDSAVNNIIFVEWVSSSRKEYWIVKEA